MRTEIHFASGGTFVRVRHDYSDWPQQFSRTQPKRNRPRPGRIGRGRCSENAISSFFLLASKARPGGSRLGGALLELVHATGGVHELLLPRVERMAHVADAHDDRGSPERVLITGSRRRTDFRVPILPDECQLFSWAAHNSRRAPTDKREFKESIGGLIQTRQQRSQNPAESAYSLMR